MVSKNKNGEPMVPCIQERRVQNLEEASADHTERLERIETSNSKILEIVSLAEGFFKVLGFLEKPLKFIALLAAAIASIIGLQNAFKKWF